VPLAAASTVDPVLVHRMEIPLFQLPPAYITGQMAFLYALT
jgi:hypothetical protein